MGKKITCIKNSKNVFRNTDLCRIFNCFLSNIFSKLNIPKQHYVQNDLDSEPELSIFKVFENHPKYEEYQK